ncbi:MAG: twin-arginine translocation signal domain-containing protein, partial [Gammaproteobacteria bacterium]|nr:twin-arginine translocation signal domain-containing protein [Gammaproteobacteria bacterium]
MNVKLNRRRFIKGVIASGIAAGTAGHRNALAPRAPPPPAVDPHGCHNKKRRPPRGGLLPQH